MPTFKNITTFHFDATERQKQHFFFMVDQMTRKVRQSLLPFYVDIPVATDPEGDLFSWIKSVDVYTYENRSQELIDNNAVGLAFFDGRIHVVFYDGPGDCYVMGMEVAHLVLYWLIKMLYPHTVVLTDEMNNWIHFAANKNYPTIAGGITSDEDYMPAQTFYFRTRLDWLKGKPKTPMSIMWYNLGAILRDGPEMNKMLKAGTAPQGPNVYWTVSELQDHTAKGIVPGALEEEDEHEKYVAMGHWVGEAS